MEEHRREHRRESERERREDESDVERRRREEGLEDVGRKGGAASMAAPYHRAGAAAAAVPVTRDLVRWGPVWAGLLISIPIQLVLSALGFAIALSALNPTAANYTQRLASTMTWWSAISFLIAMFIGGYIAGRMAAVSGVRNGLAQGTLVWALALLAGVILSALGAAGVLGTATNLQPLLARGVPLSGPEARTLISSTSTGMWWFFIGAVVAWIAAAVGGILGASARYEEVREEV